MGAAWQPPRLYLITDRHATGGRALPAVIDEVLLGCAHLRNADGRLPVAVSLREKDLLGNALIALAEQIAVKTQKHGADLFINGRLDVAIASKADGIHLPAQGLTAREVRRAAPHLRVGLSTHTPDEVAAARGLVDFVVFGPVFETPSKQGIIAPRGVDGLRAAAAHGVPVLALGGVTPERTEMCLVAGAVGVACVRAVIAANTPAAAAVAFLARFQS